MEEDDSFLTILEDFLNVAGEKVPSSSSDGLEDIPRRGSLDELIDSDVYESPYVGPIDGNAEAEIREVNGTIQLVVSPANIDYETRVEMRDAMDDLLEDANGFPLATAAGIADAVKGEAGREYIDEIVNFYRNKVPPRFRQPLIQGMALRYAEDNNPMERWEVRKRKRQAAEAHEERGHPRSEAYNTASMCSSGYFDPGRLFQQLYRNQVESGDWSDGDYADAFEELVSDRPFVVFVKSDTPAKEAYDAMVGKSLNTDNYMAPLEFIDIRGKGRRARETVEETVNLLDERHDTVRTEIEYQNGQSLLRVYHETL